MQRNDLTNEVIVKTTGNYFVVALTASQALNLLDDAEYNTEFDYPEYKGLALSARSVVRQLKNQGVQDLVAEETVQAIKTCSPKPFETQFIKLSTFIVDSKTRLFITEKQKKQAAHLQSLGML